MPVSCADAWLAVLGALRGTSLRSVDADAARRVAQSAQVFCLDGGMFSDVLVSALGQFASTAWPLLSAEGSADRFAALLGQGERAFRDSEAIRLSHVARDLGWDGSGLPFPEVAVLIRNAPVMGLSERAGRLSLARRRDIVNVRWLGYLLSEQDGWELLDVRDRDGNHELGLLRIRIHGTFVMSLGLEPMIVDRLVRSLQQVRVTRPSKGVRRAVSKARKVLDRKAYRHVPENLYEIQHVAVVEERANASSDAGLSGSGPSYQHDVQGYWRVSVLPAPEQTEAFVALEARGYELEAVSGLSERERKVAARKGLLLEDVIMVRRTWVRAHKSPSDALAKRRGLPYRRAVRVVS